MHTQCYNENTHTKERQMNNNKAFWGIFSLETLGLLLLFAGKWTRDRIISWHLDTTVADRVITLGWRIVVVGAIIGFFMLICKLIITLAQK